MIKQKYEVFNFGTTGFGIPQSLLTNRIYVKDFAPEYVFLFNVNFEPGITIIEHSYVANISEHLWFGNCNGTLHDINYDNSFIISCVIKKIIFLIKYAFT